MKRTTYVVTPAKAGVQVLKMLFKKWFTTWIPYSAVRTRLLSLWKSTAFAGMTILLVHHNSWAMASRPNPDPNAPPPPEWAKWFPIVVMVAVFYFLIIRPQSTQRKQRDNMMNNLKKGDRVVTQGGIIATVVNVGPDVLEVKLNEETKVKLRRSGVAEVLPNETAVIEPTVVK